MIIIFGILVWFILVILILKFFSVTSDIDKTTYKKYENDDAL